MFLSPHDVLCLEDRMYYYNSVNSSCLLDYVTANLKGVHSHSSCRLVVLGLQGTSALPWKSAESGLRSWELHDALHAVRKLDPIFPDG